MSEFNWTPKLICTQCTQEIPARLHALERVLTVAKRFVPEDGVIQWEQREIDLKEAIRAAEESE